MEVHPVSNDGIVRIYLSAPFGAILSMRTIKQEIEKLGPYQVVSTWINENPDPKVAPPSEAKALRDLEELSHADMLIKFPKLPGQGATSGKNQEMGVAIAMGLEILVVGGKEGIFDWLSDIRHFDSVKELFHCLGQEAQDEADLARADRFI
jgi:hypothetical protein